LPVPQPGSQGDCSTIADVLQSGTWWGRGHPSG